MIAFSRPFLPPKANPEIQILPKCNLHTHLEGSVRSDTFWELARSQGIELEQSRESVINALEVDGQEHSLVDYLEKISLTYHVLKDAEALRRTAFEAVEDAARDGVVYLELRAGPLTHSRPGLPVEVVIESILRGLNQAEETYKIVSRLIVSALRNHRPQANVHLAQAALEFRNDGVVGFDLAGDEKDYPAQLHAQAVRVAKRGGLGITIHAGEAAGAENVRYAVEALEATRIGHGVRSIESDLVLDMLHERGVLLEVCPTSNIHTRAVDSITRHPVRELFDRGIPLSIGDDDPITSKTRVSNELTLLQQYFAFSMDELREIQKMGLRAAFLHDTDLRRHISRLLDHGEIKRSLASSG